MRQSSRDIADADPKLQADWEWITSRWHAYFPGWELRLGSVYRSPEDQLAAFRGGYSKIDGFTRKGSHNYYPSRALDANVFHRATGQWLDAMLKAKKVTADQYTAMYAVFGLLAQGRGLRWGNDWDGDQLPVGPDPDESFVDVYHIELKKGE